MRGSVLAWALFVGLFAVRAIGQPSYNEEGAYLLTSPVSTQAGLVQGRVTNGVREYLGVPYAAPPVGELRWKAPQPVQPWSKPLRALAHGPACPQNLTDWPYSNPNSSSDFFGPVGNLSEDCLYLDVYAPAEDGKKHPVMFWIFGGGFQVGAAAQTLYTADALARNGVVVVVINFRFGVLGFLAHPLLSAESSQKTSGNYGMLDLVAGLQWVRDNIAGFGGDPGCVTIFGQSVGGVSVYALMASPLSQGLFHRAVIHSGTLPPKLSSTTTAANGLPSLESEGEDFAKRLGVGQEKDVLAAMRAKSWLNIVQVGFKATGAVGGGTMNCLGVDGYFLKESPAAVFAAGQQMKIPIMIGNVADEGTFFERMFEVNSVEKYNPRYPDAYKAILRGTYEKAMQEHFGAQVDEALKFYPGKTAAEARDSFIKFQTDQMFAIARFGGDCMAKIGAPTYAFLFEKQTPWTVKSWRQCFHGSDVPYVFGYFWPDLGYNDSDKKLSHQMIGYWCNFAATGNPNGSGLPVWPAYDETKQMRIRLNSKIETSGPLRVKEVDFLSQFYQPR